MNDICNRQQSRKEIQQSSIGSIKVIGTVWIGHEISSETNLCFAHSEIHVCSCIFGNCTFAIKITPTFKGRFLLFQVYRNFANLYFRLSVSSFYKEIKFQQKLRT